MIASLASSLMRRARHHTLIFHRVVRNTDPMSPSEPTQVWFRQLMKMLAGNFEMISIQEALGRMQAGRLNGRTLSVTFDDGYADNYEVALPVLEEFKVPGTFFVASGFIDGGRMWNDSIIETFRRLPAGRFELADEEPHVFDLGDWASRRNAAEKIITAWKHLPPEQRQARVDEISRSVADLPMDLISLVNDDHIRACEGNARNRARAAHRVPRVWLDSRRNGLDQRFVAGSLVRPVETSHQIAHVVDLGDEHLLGFFRGGDEQHFVANRPGQIELAQHQIKARLERHT